MTVSLSVRALLWHDPKHRLADVFPYRWQGTAAQPLALLVGLPDDGGCACLPNTAQLHAIHHTLPDLFSFLLALGHLVSRHDSFTALQDAVAALTLPADCRFSHPFTVTAPTLAAGLSFLFMHAFAPLHTMR